MVHLPASHNYEEMVATPGMARLCIAHGGVSEREATLLVKANTQILKFLTKGHNFRLIFFRIPPDNALLYGIEVDDDPSSPAFLWSIAERTEEIEAAKQILFRQYSIIHIFNEAAVNVGWAEPEYQISHSDSANFLNHIQLIENGSTLLSEHVAAFFDRSTRSKTAIPGAIVATPSQNIKWNQVTVTVITNSLNPSTLEILEANEGDQQEHLAVWLTDALALTGAHKGPIAHEKKPRELTDVLIAYQYGLFLIESKISPVLTANSDTTRDKIKKNISKNIRTAISQHSGACRNIANGTKITTKSGQQIDIPRTLPIHCIVLIPELALIADQPEFGRESVEQFGQRTGHFLHILDPDALMGIILNANTLAYHSDGTTPLEAFDYILMERWKQSLEIETAYFKFTVKLSPNK